MAVDMPQALATDRAIAISDWVYLQHVSNQSAMSVMLQHLHGDALYGQQRAIYTSK